MALGIAEEYGLSAMAALHIGAAVILNAAHLFTTEKPGRPLYWITDPQVIHVRDAAGGHPRTWSAT